MKRNLSMVATLLALLVVVSPVFGTAETEDSEEAVTLNIMHNWGVGDSKGPVTADVFESFMEMHPHITIEDEVFKDLDIPTKIEVAFVAGREPDIVFSNYFQTVPNWLSQGIIVPVNDYLDEWGLRDRMVPAGLTSFTESDGRIAGFPLEGFNWPVWYNMDIAEAAGIGIPRTINELRAAIPKIRAAGYEPYVTAGNDGEGHIEFEMFALQFLTDDEIIQVFNNGNWSLPNAVKGVQLFVEMREAGLFSEDTPGLTNQTKPLRYYEGDVFMQHGGSWAYSAAPEEIQEVVILGGFPVADGSVYPNPGWQTKFTAKGVYVTRNGAQKESAVEDFVTYLYSPEVIRRYVVETSILSPVLDVDLSDVEGLNTLFVQSINIAGDLSVIPIPDPGIPSNVNLISMTKQFYLPESAGGLDADEIIDMLSRAWAQALQ